MDNNTITYSTEAIEKSVINRKIVEVHPGTGNILIFVKVDPTSIELEKGFTRDVSNIGHFGTGNLEITVSSQEDFEKAHGLLQKSYEAS